MFNKDIKKLEIKDSEINIKYNSDEKFSVYSKGRYTVDNGNLQNFELTNNSFKNSNDLKINFETDQEINIDIINFKKKKGELANISSKMIIKKDVIDFKKLNLKRIKI